ncbi:MAG: imidazole glycerol phosphate synthase subunit HisH, partial [Alphaproteobacteria bacterium]
MSERVAIIDCGSGNLRSVAKACERAAAENGLRRKIVLARSAEAATAADRLILPGVGAFAACRAGIAAIDGMEEVLRAHVEA